MSQALARAFNQWNQMLIDQQQWNVAREERNQDFALKSMMMEEDAKDRAMQRENLKLGMQAQKQQIELNQQAVNNLREYQRPQEISLSNYVNDAILTSEGREKVSNLFKEHGEDVTLSQADGMLMSGGRIVPIAPSEIASKLSMLDLINRAYQDIPSKLIKAQGNAELELDQATKDYNFWKKQPESRFGPRAANAKTGMMTAQKKLDRVNKALEPKAQASFYGREAGDYESQAAYFRRFGKAAADQVEWLELQGEKLRKNEQIWLAKALGEKESKPKTYYRIHNDVSDPESYGRVHSQVTVYPSTDVDKLIPDDGTMVLSESPRFPQIDDGTGGEGGGKKKLPTPMNYDQLDGNIHTRYQIAINAMGKDATSGAVFEKRETHKKISKAIALASPQDAPDRFERADYFGEIIVDQMETVYHQTMDKIREFSKQKRKTGEKVFLNHVDNAYKSAKKNGFANLPPQKKVYAKFAEAVEKGQASPNLQGFEDWYNYTWKQMYLGMVDDTTNTENHGITESHIYIPDKFTRDMRKLMMGMEIN
jgi:hypothetical protein